MISHGSNFGVTSHAFVLDLGDETRVAIHIIGHRLQATVGKKHKVRPFCVVSVAGIVMAEVVATVVSRMPSEVVFGRFAFLAGRLWK